MSHPLSDFAAAVALLLCGLAVLRSSLLDLLQRRLLPVLLRDPASRARTLAAGVAAGAGVRHGAVLPRLLGPALDRGSLPPATALEALLAAGAGAALVTSVLAANPAGVYQLALVAGTLMVLARNATLVAAGRALIGAALALMALRLLVAGAGAPAPDAPIAIVAGMLERDILLAATVGTLASLLLRTSMGTVLLLGVLCAQQVLPAGAALAMMLGANLGSAVMTWTATTRDQPQARQVAAAALLVRMPAVACGLLLHDALAGSVARSADPALALAVAHLAFNLTTALLATGFTLPLLAAVARWMPACSAAPHGRLEPDAPPPTTPSVALTSAAREVVRLADLVELMLRGMLQVFLRGDAALARSVRGMDDAVDTSYRAVKHYLAGVRRMRLSGQELRRWNELMTFAIALEQTADGAERVLDDLERRAPAFSATFPAPAVAEICSLHTILMHNARLAVMLLLRRDAGVARELVTAHAAFVDTLRMYQAAHLQRLCGQEPASAAVSALYLDLLGDFARLNTLVCSLADAFLPLHERLSGLPGATGSSAPAWRGAMPLLQEAK
jgi:phosphate:Na+ symporter